MKAKLQAQSNLNFDNISSLLLSSIKTNKFNQANKFKQSKYKSKLKKKKHINAIYPSLSVLKMHKEYISSLDNAPQSRSIDILIDVIIDFTKMHRTNHMLSKTNGHLLLSSEFMKKSIRHFNTRSNLTGTLRIITGFYNRTRKGNNKDRLGASTYTKIEQEDTTYGCDKNVHEAVKEYLLSTDPKADDHYEQISKPKEKSNKDSKNFLKAISTPVKALKQCEQCEQSNHYEQGSKTTQSIKQYRFDYKDIQDELNVNSLANRLKEKERLNEYMKEQVRNDTYKHAYQKYIYKKNIAENNEIIRYCKDFFAKLTLKGNIRSTQYYTIDIKESTSMRNGRVYSYFTSLPSKVRDFIFNGISLDGKNMAFATLYNKYAKEGLDLPYMKDYVQNREKHIRLLCDFAYIEANVLNGYEMIEDTDCSGYTKLIIYDYAGEVKKHRMTNLYKKMKKEAKMLYLSALFGSNLNEHFTDDSTLKMLRRTATGVNYDNPAHHFIKNLKSDLLKCCAFSNVKVKDLANEFMKIETSMMNEIQNTLKSDIKNTIRIHDEVIIPFIPSKGKDTIRISSINKIEQISDLYNVKISNVDDLYDYAYYHNSCTTCSTCSTQSTPAEISIIENNKVHSIISNTKLYDNATYKNFSFFVRANKLNYKDKVPISSCNS